MTDTEPPEPMDGVPKSFDGQSVDKRLDALMETIRTWDWRAASVKVGTPPADPTASMVPPPTTARSPEVREDPEPLTLEPPPGKATADTQPVVVEPMPRSATFDPQAPEDAEGPADDASSLSELGPEHPIARLWSHPRAKLAILCLAAVVAVLLIIGGIRLVNKNPNLGAPSTTVTTAPGHVHHTAFVAPIDAAQLTKYVQYAQGLQTANGVATKGFVSVGSTPTLTQLTAVATAYRSALNLYDFQLNFIQWPASMLTAIALEHTQLKALMSFLPSISSVSPTGISTWLSELHSRTGFAQTADNQIRQDLGLPISTSFP